ncbi:type IV pilus biogenesis/stability protein PilW [Hahella sp. KA22]|uniref:type IV pilus biogenesis/stability protein PilW n=1 Tax=Hahella sp. KA22 TaxID=1628392 RepID=UPI000FDD5776|nr:type IV pilus biogenesis/stability protein PilW [Hahella sp. KA22]AZZ93317.1 type IV pilus biogenesis/stability protein PilW [Hahella sp. KA22]QAY56691.1 type IV pilus biogenesis/stability protein PilW [Hahella sp. KA22]
MKVKQELITKLRKMENVKRTIKTVVLAVVLGGVLAGCVTTVTGPYTNKASEDKAVQQYVQLGLAYYQQGDLDSALQKLQRALEIKPDNAEAQAALGLVYQRQKEPLLAEKQFKSALRSDPGFTRGRTYYAAYLYDQGRYKEAAEQLDKASEDVNYESRAQVFSNIGLIRLRLGETEQAIKAYEKSLTLKRGQPNVVLALASLYFGKGELSKANRMYAVHWETVRRGGASHTPASLALGIKIAREKKDLNEEASLMLLLKNMFPNSAEYKTMKGSS